MKVIKSVLEEELANSLAMQKDYEKELAKLPKGSLIKKMSKGTCTIIWLFEKKGKLNLSIKARKLATKKYISISRPKNIGQNTGNSFLRSRSR